MPSLELKYCNDKVWVENPRSCQNLKKTECQPETKFKTVKKPSQKCGRVAYDDCQNVPYEKCDLVTKQDCQNESFQVIFNLRLLYLHSDKKPKVFWGKSPVLYTVSLLSLSVLYTHDLSLSGSLF